MINPNNNKTVLYKRNSSVSFTGKERDEETGYSYFGARYYDSDLSGLFLSVDPMANKYPSISPYAYCAWNPLKATDPNGMDSIHTPNGMANAGQGYKVTDDGQYLYGEGLQTKKWNPDLEVGGVVGLRGGYENCDDNELPDISNAQGNEALIAAPVAITVGSILSEVFSNIVDVVVTASPLVWVLPACMLVSGDSRQNATDNSNNEKHGDRGRAKAKVNKQVEQLELQLQNAPKKERRVIERKIKNIKRNAEKKEKGIEHSRANKR